MAAAYANSTLGEKECSRLMHKERRDFVDEHIAHRLTALLSVIRRQPAHPNFFTGRGDVYRASIEGSYLMLRVFIEFLGVESARHDGKLALAKRGNLRWHSESAHSRLQKHSTTASENRR
jgi:hypothetical protein